MFPRKAVTSLAGRLFIPMIELLIFLPPALASDAAQRPPSGLEVRIEATPGSATVGDPIRIDLDVTLPAGYQAEVSGIEKQVGDFSILEFFPGPSIPEPDKTPAPVTTLLHHRARIVAAVYKTGIFTFPPVQIRLRTAEGKQAVTSSPPVKIEIRSVLSEKDRSLKDLKKQAEMAEPVRWILWLTVLLALGLGALAWVFWRRRRKRASSIPSLPRRDLLDVAEEELRQLLARGFPETGMVKHFYVVLSERVKKILEAAYGIHTAERTTSEIIDSLRCRPGGMPEDIERIESFLLRCDIVKFAKYIPSQTEHKSAAEDALRLLEKAREYAVGRGQSAVGSPP